MFRECLRQLQHKQNVMHVQNTLCMGLYNDGQCGTCPDPGAETPCQDTDNNSVPCGDLIQNLAMMQDALKTEVRK